MNHRITAHVIVLAALGAAPLTAQKIPPRSASRTESRPDRLYRGGVGVSAGTAGMGLAFDLSMNSPARLYRIRLSIHDNAALNMGGGPSQRLTISETAFMIGRGRPLGRTYGSVAAGVAAVGVDRHDDPPAEHLTLGVPLEAQLISGRPLKLGATLAANLNLERSLAAFILSIQIGRVP